MTKITDPPPPRIAAELRYLRASLDEEIPADQCSSFCLSDEELMEIGRLSKILEQHFGLSKNVEWL